MIRLEDLAGRSFSYAELGASRNDVVPAGFEAIRHGATVGTGRAQFRAAADALMRLEVHEAAGLRVSSRQRDVAPGLEILLELGRWPLRIHAPCRVVYLVVRENVVGFAYGSLEGHPESGEEAFLVELDEHDQVQLTIIGFSRPARWYSKLAPPATRLVQHRILTAYAKAMRRLVVSARCSGW